jgi:hypothetical protein
LEPAQSPTASVAGAVQSFKLRHPRLKYRLSLRRLSAASGNVLQIRHFDPNRRPHDNRNIRPPWTQGSEICLGVHKQSAVRLEGTAGEPAGEPNDTTVLFQSAANADKSMRPMMALRAVAIFVA